MSERVCVFVDGANFYNQLKDNLKRTDIDFGPFAEWLASPARTLVRTYYYTVPLTQDHPEAQRKAQQKFFGALDHIPYFETRLGKLVRRQVTCPACGDHRDKWVEKGVDMRVGVDMVAGAAKGLYDTAVLVSGDGDLAEAIAAVKDLGKHVELAAFPKNRAYALVQAADVSKELTVADVTPFLRHP